MGDVFDAMGAKWPSNVVARTEISKFSGGLLNPKTMANIDSLKMGPGTIQFGRKVAYEVKALVSWMRARAEKVS